MIGLNDRAASSSGRSAGVGSGGCTSKAPSEDSPAMLSGFLAELSACAMGTMSSARRWPLPSSDATMLAPSTTTGRMTSITTRDLPGPERPA